MKDNGTNGTAATKNMKTLQELNAVPSYETSVLSDEAHVKKEAIHTSRYQNLLLQQEQQYI